MNIHEFDIMNYLLDGRYINQRIIAETTNYSLGKVNEAVQKLTEEGYLDQHFNLTDQSHNEINRKKPKNAIILAAGFGMRMVPINTELPKGLLEVDGETLIERLIKQLHEVKIYEIDIVVGFMKDKYEFLIDKYGVNLVYNPNYALKNNIHSLNLLVNKISNTYILPCDIWSEKNPFSKHELYSWYSVSELIDEESNVRINRQRELVKTHQRGNKMIGISYLLEEDAESVRENIKVYCQKPEYDNAYWEEALFTGDERITIYVRIHKKDEIFEVDTYEELRELDKESNNLKTDTISLIAEELSVKANDIKDIEILKKGLTNRSFKFKVKDKEYIMRVPGEGTDKLINRDNEYTVYQRIKEFKISDDLVYISPETGYKITEFLHDAKECDPFNPKEVKQSMQKLRAFHGLKLKVDHIFDLYGTIEFYESLWEGEPSIFRDYQETKSKIFELKPMIDSIPKDWVLTHVDSVANNILFVDDEVRLIDWEYAGMQDPHLDIAMFALSAMYNRTEVDALIDSYFAEGCSPETRMKIYIYISAGGLLWSNWCEVKRFQGVEFGEYSLKQYRFAKEYYTIVIEEYLKNK